MPNPAASATRTSATPRVLADVLDGFTTAELADRDYGVVLKEVNGQLTVDLRSTAERRDVLVSELSSAI